MPETEINTAPAADAAPALGSELRALRVAANLTLRELAVKIAYSHVAIHKAEKCLRRPSWELVESIVKVCAPLGEDLDWWKGLWSATCPTPLAKLAVTRPLVPVEPTESLAAPRPRRAARRVVPTATSLPADTNAIRTVRDYTEALSRLRTRSYREIEKRGAKVLTAFDNPETYTYLWHRRKRKPASVSSSTLADLFRPGRRWLEWRVVRAFLLGCDVSPADLKAWQRLLGRVQGYSRPAPARQFKKHTPPPQVNLDGIDSVATFVTTLKELARKSGKTMDTIISDASHHRGAHIPGRSTVAARFSRGVNHGELPERRLVKAFLRGAYCSAWQPYNCPADCNEDEIAPWMRVYDELVEHNGTEH
jgi:transcriptional regulator with XRE-family HTH domain